MHESRLYPEGDEPWEIRTKIWSYLIRKIELKWEYSGSGCGRENDMHPWRIIQYHGFLHVKFPMCPEVGGWVGVELTYPEIRLYFRFALKITFRRARRNEKRA